MAKKEDQLTGLDWATNIGSGAATGLATGAAFGPVGMGVGAGLGAGLGVVKSVVQNRELADAAAQQADLDRKLAMKQNVDAFQTSSALALGAQRAQAQQEADAQAARMGLTPGSAANLRTAALSQVNAQGAQDRAAGMGAAAAADRANREEILNEFNTAQGLANNATSGSQRLDDTYAKLTEAASYLSGMRTKPATEVPLNVTELQPKTLGEPQSIQYGIDFSQPYAPALTQPQGQGSRQVQNPYDLGAGSPLAALGTSVPTQASGGFGGLPTATPAALSAVANGFNDGQLRDPTFLTSAGVDPALQRAAKVIETADPSSPEWQAAAQLLYGY